MLMMLGPVQFEVMPFNTDGYGHGHEAGFAEKPVLGTRPVLEFVGEGPESWTIRAKLFPATFGGMGQLELLYQARASGRPQYMMRGDGALMGWVVILSVSERASYLDRNGVGKVIDVDISVKRCGSPGAGSFFSLLADVLLWNR
ncbi:phage tail protein [Oricola sp.]|uniref:phage tail protein n=1 Tax=Oricola sp. TaxID=1979950 RepID=UPI0025EBBC04|nr:phage tail protein [Oricola sp.]MCI5078700.1 phage tail protein [Oricola sp.]